MIAPRQQPQALRGLVDQIRLGRMRRPTATTVSAARMNAPRNSSSSCTDLSATSALARGQPVGAGTRQLAPFRGLVDIVGRNASGSMPAWLSRLRRRGEPEARTNLGRPSMRVLVGGGNGVRNARGTYRKALRETTTVLNRWPPRPLTTAADAQQQSVTTPRDRPAASARVTFGAGRIVRRPIFHRAARVRVSSSAL